MRGPLQPCAVADCLADLRPFRAIGDCLDEKTYYSIECERDDTECLQRKRRLASKEFDNFLTDPLSSPVFLLASIAFATPWISIVTKYTGRLLERLFPPSDSNSR